MTAWRAVALAALVSGAGATIGLVHDATAPRIAANDAAHDEARLRALVPAATARTVIEHDGDIVRFIDGGVPIAQVRSTTADGYAGPIELLLALDAEHVIVGIDVLSHRETPGLGDAIEPRRSHWLVDAFVGHRAGTARALRRDGGDIDGITGATITTRAVAAAVAGATTPASSPR